MNDLRNPYIAGAPVVESSMFFGREDVFQWIENSLTGKYVDHILVLHGQRRVGKTTVLKQIPNFLPKSYIQVFYDLQGRTNTSLDRFLWWMASEIVRTLNRNDGFNLSRPERSAFTDPDDFLTDFLPHIRENLDGHTLLLTFDEFDTLARPDIQDTLARPLINFLRRLFDSDFLTFIFSIGSSGNKLENMQAAYTDFFKTALYRKVSFLTEDECIKLITEPVKDVITYQPEAIQRITQVTSGHPYFTQLTCHELFSRCQTSGSREITLQDVDEILDDVIERGTVNLKFVWDEASDLEKWILATLAMEEGIPQKKIGKTLDSLGVRFSKANLNSAILHLRDKDVLTRENTFIILLMKRWLNKNRPMDRVREELVQTNPIADRYLEIGHEYRDRKQFGPAIESYQQALAVQANNLDALYNIGEIHLDQQRYRQAADHFEKALQVDEEYIAARQGFCQAYLAVGDQARQAGDSETAIDAYLTILNLTPVHAQARQNLADIYQERAEAHLDSGNDQEALAALRQAMEMTPEDQSLKNRYQQIIEQKKAALVQSWLDKAERAIKRKRWDEAVRMADKALEVDPGDDSLRARVTEIKDAPRLAKLKTYRQEAESAINNQHFDQAINAIEAALLLDPDNGALQDWLDATQVNQKKARLDQLNRQAVQAIQDGDWEAALAAREKALDLDPENDDLMEALEETRAARLQAQLDKLRGQAQAARLEERWEDAIQKAEKMIELAPEDTQAQTLLKDLNTAQRQAHLQDLLDQGESAFRNEAWSEAVRAWEAYLDEEPEALSDYQDRLAHARLYTELSAEYEQAQNLIKDKQFSKAVPLLQGIIAKDPSYKATSRLLVEAVEARRKRAPKIKPLWLLSGIAIIALIVLGVYFRTQITQLIIGLFQPQPEVEAISLDPLPFTGNDAAEPSNAQERFSSEVHAFMEQTPPTFEDDFSSGKTEWGMIETPIGSWPMSYFVDGDAFHLDFHNSSPYNGQQNYKTILPNNDLFSGTDFVFSLKTKQRAEFRSWDFPGLIFYASDDLAEYYELTILPSKLIIFHYSENGNEVLQTINHEHGYRMEEFDVIAYRDTISIEINGEMIICMQRPEINGDNNYLNISRNAPLIEDVKFWNLKDETIFSEEIIALVDSHIETQEPTLSDDFSTPNTKLGTLIRGDESLPVEDFISNGLLNLTANKEIIKFPEGNEINSGHFALTFDFDPVSTRETGEAVKLSFMFRAAPDTSSYYIMDFYPAEDIWQVAQFADSAAQVLDQGSYDGTTNHNIKLMVYEHHTAIFLDEEQIFYSNSTMSNNETNIFYLQGVGDWQINFGYLSFWDLQDIENVAGERPINTAAAQTATSEPFYADTPFANVMQVMDDQPPTLNENFSDVDDQWLLLDEYSEDTTAVRPYVIDGKLTLPGFMGNMRLINVEMSNADNFILSFDFSSEENFHELWFLFRNTENSSLPNEFQGYNFGFANKSVGQVILAGFGDESFENMNENIGELVTDRLYHVTIVAHENSIGVFLNDQLIFSNNNAQIIEGHDNYFLIKSVDPSNYAVTFDNIKFWDLDQLERMLNSETDSQTDVSEVPETVWMDEFAQPILNFIETKPAEIDNDFDDDDINGRRYLQIPNTSWILDDRSQNDAEINNGQLHLINNSAVYFKDFSYQDFVLEIDLDIMAGGSAGFSLHDHACELKFNNYSVIASCNGEELMVKDRVFVNPNLTNSVRLIVQDKHHLVFINDFAYGHFEYESQGEESLTLFTEFDNSRLEGLGVFDNIKIWDIAEIIAETEETVSATEEAARDPWSQENFADPILAYIENNPPDVEDDFTTNTGDWRFTTWTDPDRRGIRIADGELLLYNATLYHRNVTFQEYVVEVEARQFEHNQSYGIEFNMHSCKMYFDNPSGWWKVICNDNSLMASSINNNIKDHLRLICKDSHIAVFVNEILIGIAEEESLGTLGSTERLSLFVEDPNSGAWNSAAFSNFKVWDLTDFTLP